ncbi:acyl--CoA ligase [Paracoccaceae bacterium]|nr:acyl--CoA ligase [Paracoccaceae bacterium]
MNKTINEIVNKKNNDLKALGAPDRQWSTYGDLKKLTAYVSSRLRSYGIAVADRVAIVLPNGPEMASAFITMAQSCTTAPLNPNYREEEYLFYLKDLNAKALVVLQDYNGPALAAANHLNISVIKVSVNPEHLAGEFELLGEIHNSVISQRLPTPQDVALILHTSGTTSKPKIVPLLHSNIVSSAENIKSSLSLSEDDLCMNIMPLFHIHGLIAALSASIAAGGSVWCSPGFDALKFFRWLDDASPSWYTAVPTMHQAILARSKRNKDTIEKNKLRFLRSSSASLPSQVMKELERVFSAPIIEGYGMTEATHQMASNPLPPLVQKPGSVGREAGPKIRIAHELENHLIDGTGEVVISGPNVTPGYENNFEANKKSFFYFEGERWFRTGDQGAFDRDGYLSLTGRLKEIINRGGEKISPLEVDEVLMDHPSVAQVVTFAVPHEKLGEDVAAALVLEEGSEVTENDLRAFASDRMVEFKVPKQIVILSEIPKGATGKLQRIGLAKKLGLA